VFHTELKEVSFIECNLINLTDLERCTKLHTLRISSTCSLNSYENVAALSADTFLPDLKRFSSKICLGAVSALFEEKSTLNWLHLKCCHLHIQVLQFNSVKIHFIRLITYIYCVGMHSIEVALLGDRRIANAYVMPTPINIKLKFRPYVRCLLDPMS